MEALGECEDTEIFYSNVVQDFIEFNWNAYAKHTHMLGAFIHFTYMIVFLIYVN